MAYSKAEQFEAIDLLLARYAKALSHPARIAILRLLAERKACICGDIVEELPLSQSTVSQHLQELKQAGFIKGEIDGPRVCYCINPDEAAEAEKLFEALFSFIRSAQCSC